MDEIPEPDKAPLRLHTVDWRSLYKPEEDEENWDHNDYVAALEHAATNDYELLVAMLKQKTAIEDPNLLPLLGLIVERLKNRQRDTTGRLKKPMKPTPVKVVEEKVGAPRKLPTDMKQSALQDYRDGQSITKIARRCEVSYSTIYRLCESAGILRRRKSL